MVFFLLYLFYHLNFYYFNLIWKHKLQRHYQRHLLLFFVQFVEKNAEKIHMIHTKYFKSNISTIVFKFNGFYILNIKITKIHMCAPHTFKTYKNHWFWLLKYLIFGFIALSVIVWSAFLYIYFKHFDLFGALNLFSHFGK